MARKKLSETGNKTIQIRVPVTEYDALVASAKQTGRSLSDFVRATLRDRLEAAKRYATAPQLSPEWETANERTVKWNKEQTSHLRESLGVPDKRCDDCKRKGVSWAVCKETCKHKR